MKYRKRLLLPAVLVIFTLAGCADTALPPSSKGETIMTENASTHSTEKETENIPDVPLGISVLDYGADPKGREDSTEAIQQACSENRHVYFPAGTYKISTLTVLGSVTLSGDGDNATVLKTTNLTDNVITFKGDGWHIRDMKFDCARNRTSGAYVYSTTDYASIENVAVNNHYIGFDLDGCWSVNLENISAFDGTPHQVAEGGSIIRLGKTAYTGPINIRGLTAKTSNAFLQPSSGIHMGYVDVVSISDALIIWHKKDIIIAPDGQQFAALIEITNSCLDTAENGIYIEPTNGARVLRCGVANTWFGAHTSDAAVIDGSGGTVTGLQFTNCMFLCNAGNGLSVTGDGTDGIFISNSFSSGNLGNGLVISGNAQNVMWSGGVLGASHECQGNLIGYTAEEGCSGSVINTLLKGNREAACEDPSNALVTSGNLE